MAHGRNESVANPWRTAWKELVAVVGFLALATPALAFTEPTEAPPGGNAISAPVNVSTTQQTKPGRLNLTGTYDTGLVPALAVGTAAIPKQICWNDDCKGSWSDITGTGVQLRQAATVDWLPPTLWDGTNSDSGNVSVRARDNQIWAIGGLAAAVPAGRFLTAGVYGSSVIAAPAAGQVSAGVLGYSATANSYGLYAVAFSGGYAGYFGGSVGINQQRPNATFVVTRDSIDGRGSSDDAAAFYASSFNSAVYAEQRALAGHAGYFSGRLSAVGRTTQDSVLRVRCTSDLDPFSPTFNAGGTRCLDVDLNRPTGGFVWQTFRHGYDPTTSTAGAEKWWFRSDVADFAFGLDARTGVAGSESTTSVLRVTPSGNVGIAGNILPNPKLLVNKFVVGGGNDALVQNNAGNAANAVDIITNTADTALYVQQSSTNAAAWAGYFSGRVNVTGELCIAGDCRTAWPVGGPGTSQWTLNAGTNTIFPNSSSRRIAIGGSSETAPFYYDPGANVFSLLDPGYLALQGGALYLKEPPSGDQPPPDLGAAGGVKPGERLADLLKPRAVLAGSVTNPGSAPPVRLFVRDGVVSIEASGSKLELGNAGRDIASNSDLYLRPQSVAGGSNAARFTLTPTLRTKLEVPYLSLSNPDTTAPLSISHSGAATSLSISNTSTVLGSSTVLISNSATSASGHGLRANVGGVSNASSSLYGFNASTSGWAGYFEGRVNVTSSLCFGGSGGGIGGTDCRTSWPTLEGGGGGGDPGTSYWTLSSVASRAFLSPKDISQAVYIGNRPTSTDNTSLSVYNNSSNSALYAQQENTASWAGYFSGGLNVGGGTPSLGGPRGSKFHLGFALDNSGVQWQYNEAEYWSPGSTSGGCVTPDYLDSVSSQGRAVRFGNGSASCPSGVIYYSSTPITLPTGSYTLTARIRASTTTAGRQEQITFGFYSGGDVTGREVSSPGPWYVKAGYHTFSYNFLVDSPSSTRLLGIKLPSELSLNSFWLVDWVMIVPNTDDFNSEAECYRHGQYMDGAPTTFGVDLELSPSQLTRRCFYGCDVTLTVAHSASSTIPPTASRASSGKLFAASDLYSFVGTQATPGAAATSSAGALPPGAESTFLSVATDASHVCQLTLRTSGNAIRTNNTKTTLHAQTCYVSICTQSWYYP